jgi:hypothetical protein
MTDWDTRHQYAVARVIATAREVVAHVSHNAQRDPTAGYSAACALLMRLDAPVGQLIEALTKLDLVDLDYDEPEDDE